MGKKIVFAVWGSLGDLNPYLAIAQRLQKAGHHCVIATTNFHRERVETAGFTFAPMGPHLDADADLIRQSMHLRRGPRFLLRDTVIPYVRQAFTETMTAIQGADLLVTHPIAYGAHIAAQKSGIRWASSALAPSGFFSQYDGFVRTQQPALERFGDSAAWIDAALMRYVRFVTRRWAAQLLQLRRELGLDTRGHPIMEGQFSPQLTLAMFSRLFAQPQSDWPENTVISGFPFYDDAAGLNQRLLNFLSNGEPPVVFTLGSAASLAPRRFFEESLRAIAQLRCRAVLIVGLFGPNQFDDGLPENVIALPYASYELLFSRARAIVHHGGIGTTSQALRAGRPMLVVPFAFDQPDNAARAKRLGVARRLFIQQYKARHVVRDLEPLLRDRSYQERATKLGEQIRSEDGVGHACSELEKLLPR